MSNKDFNEAIKEMKQLIEGLNEKGHTIYASFGANCASEKADSIVGSSHFVGDNDSMMADIIEKSISQGINSARKAHMISGVVIAIARNKDLFEAVKDSMPLLEITAALSELVKPEKKTA